MRKWKKFGVGRDAYIPPQGNDNHRKYDNTKNVKSMVKLPLVGKLAPLATDEVAAEDGKRQNGIEWQWFCVRCRHLIHRKRSPFPSRGRLRRVICILPPYVTAAVFAVG